MIDAKNLVTLTCGLVADPEQVNDNIVKFRVAVDYAGSEKGTDNNSGYFDVTYYLSDGGRNADFVRNQVKEGKLAKGSQIQLVGRLVQERWTGDGDKKSSRVVVVAESVNYASRGGTKTEGSTSAAPAAAASSAPSAF